MLLAHEMTPKSKSPPFKDYVILHNIKFLIQVKNQKHCLSFEQEHENQLVR